MKTLFIWIVIVAATIESTTGQLKNQNRTNYGFAISQFISQSGFQPGYDIHFTIQPNRKAKVGFGVFIDNETQEFSGISFNHQRFLFANKKRISTFQPFIMYNFIYRKTTSLELIESIGGISHSDNWVTYTSIEHHLGFGLNVNISNNILLSCGMGYGLYLGSIKRPSNPDPTTREITGTNGRGYLIKTGIGFRF